MSPPSQPPHHPHGCGPAFMLHMSLAAAGSFPDSAGRLNSADEMHGCEGLNPHAGPVVGARQSALSCKLSDTVVKVSVEHLHSSSHCSI